MATQLETTGALERRLSLSVPMADIGAQVQKKLRDLARTVRMPGFRPGKVPMKMIEASYGTQVQAEVLGDAVSKAFSDAVGEHGRFAAQRLGRLAAAADLARRLFDLLPQELERSVPLGGRRAQPVEALLHALDRGLDLVE